MISRIMVTGANGFLGCHVMEALRLSPLNLEVVALARRPKWYERSVKLQCVCYGDLTDERFVQQMMERYKPQAIIHLASNPIVKLNTENPSAIINDNVVTINNLLAKAPEGCVFVNASSATVYGDCRDGHIVRHPRIPGVCEATKMTPNSVYGATKAATEHLVNAYTSLGRVRGVNLRLVANVGRWATHGLLRDLISKLRSDSKNLQLLGDWPGSTKPFLHVEDTAQAFLLAATNPQWLGRYPAVNIAPKESITVEQVANIVMETLGVRKPIEWLGEEANWKGDNRVVEINSCMVVGFLGWRPKCRTSAQSIEKAVNDIVAWEMNSKCEVC